MWPPNDRIKRTKHPYALFQEVLLLWMCTRKLFKMEFPKIHYSQNWLEWSGSGKPFTASSFYNNFKLSKLSCLYLKCHNHGFLLRHTFKHFRVLCISNMNTWFFVMFTWQLIVILVFNIYVPHSRCHSSYLAQNRHWK